MKAVKMSLVAVMAMGASAFAIDNVKMNGDAKVWYTTAEYSGAGASATEKGYDLFNKGGNTVANTKLSIGATADLLQNLSAGVKVTALSTLGLENNLVGDTPTNKQKITGTATTVAERVSDQSWAEEAYLAYTAGKTTAKIGRQSLSTPLAFSEDWNIVSNTFEAAVLLNNDLPDTTLVGAWVGKHNGVGLVGGGRGSVVAYNGEFGNFGLSGAYAAAAINKSLPDTTLQAWYYNVLDVADAVWVQADAKVAGMVNLGAQFANMNPKLGAGTADRTSNMFAVKAAVDVADFNVYAAYSSVSEGTLGFANVATGDKSSIYTSLGSIYMDGEVMAAPDTKAWKVGASTKMIPGVALSASYAEAEIGANEGAMGAVQTAGYYNADYKAWDIIAKTKAGPVDLAAYYTQFTNDAIDKRADAVRIIAGLKF